MPSIGMGDTAAAAGVPRVNENNIAADTATFFRNCLILTILMITFITIQHTKYIFNSANMIIK